LLVSREKADTTKENGMARSFALNTLSCSLEKIGTCLLELLTHHDMDKDLIKELSDSVSGSVLNNKNMKLN
jgi:hypothetical protein